MNHRQFGRQGWNISDIGYGMWGMAVGPILTMTNPLHRYRHQLSWL